jgi:hypothetical protein
MYAIRWAHNVSYYEEGSETRRSKNNGEFEIKIKNPQFINLSLFLHEKKYECSKLSGKSSFLEIVEALFAHSLLN